MQLNVLNDLAEATKALDGEKNTADQRGIEPPLEVYQRHKSAPIPTSSCVFTCTNLEQTWNTSNQTVYKHLWQSLSCWCFTCANLRQTLFTSMSMHCKHKTTGGVLHFRSLHSGCGSPAHWTYSSATEKSSLLDGHWLAVSRLMVILARSHGSDSSSDVSCGGTVGSSWRLHATSATWGTRSVRLALRMCNAWPLHVNS